MAAEKWYLGGSGDGVSAPYTPATWKGSWDSTGTGTVLFSPYKIGSNASSNRAETSASNPFKVGILRGISPKLAAQTITGTVDMVMSVLESNVAADFFTRLHLYVTQGDSDLVRGTLLNQYDESGTGTEWPTTATGYALVSPQALSSVAAVDGDRLVIEIGYTSTNAVTTSRTGTVRRGGRSSLFAPLADLTAGSTSVTTLASYFEFSNAITLLATEPTNLTPETATAIGAFPYSPAAIDVSSNAYALWFTRSVVSGDNGYISLFAGVDAGSGNYLPQLAEAYLKVGSDYIGFNEIFSLSWRAYAVPVDAGDALYWRIVASDTTLSPPQRNLVVTGRIPPVLPVDLTGYILITEDTTSGVLRPAGVIDPTDGTIDGYADVIHSENGVVADDGTVLLSDKYATNNNRLVIYNASVTSVVATITTQTTAAGQSNVPVAYDGTYFYSAQYQAALPGILVSRLTLAGAVADTWTIPLPAGWTSRVNTIAVSRDGATLYYTRSTATQPVKRWDLVNDLALADFYTPAANTYANDIFVLGDGTVLFSLNNFTASTFSVVRYDAAGVLQNTYSVSDPFAASTGSYFLDHITPGVDDPLSFWIWFQQDNAIDSNYKDYEWHQIRVSDGVVLTERDEPQDSELGVTLPFENEDVPDYWFGIPDSCPLVILGSREGEVEPPPVEPTVWAIRWVRRVPHVRAM